ncbi:MAG: sigma-70 family RNA polymerase sigma factor [Planctomycetes bacterium]|nr:sigma-70 family RNA polymerase sigma factor [Planctomycetota bacterium]
MSDPTAQTLSLDQFAGRFERAAPALWCVAAAVLGSRDAAEDVVQEAALQAMAKLATFRAGSDFTAWMARIVRFRALNQRRRLRREPRSFDPDMPGPDRAEGKDARCIRGR